MADRARRAALQVEAARLSSGWEHSIAEPIHAAEQGEPDRLVAYVRAGNCRDNRFDRRDREELAKYLIKIMPKDVGRPPNSPGREMEVLKDLKKMLPGDYEWLADFIEIRHRKQGGARNLLVREMASLAELLSTLPLEVLKLMTTVPVAGGNWRRLSGSRRYLAEVLAAGCVLGIPPQSAEVHEKAEAVHSFRNRPKSRQTLHR